MTTSVDLAPGSVQPVACVFCASSPGSNPVHLESARILGESLARAGYKLVYGGGTSGIMGQLARTVVKHSTPENVDGIIPRALVKLEAEPDRRNDSPSAHPAAESHSNGNGNAEVKGAEASLPRKVLERRKTDDVIPQTEFGRTIVVPDMHTRKRMMCDSVVNGAAGSGFVALAGGYGTIEEVMEMVTWNQLGIHKMPIVLVNINGYWDGLINWVRNSIEEGFVSQGNANILVEVKRPEDVEAALRSYKVAEGRFRLDWSDKEIRK